MMKILAGHVKESDFSGSEGATEGLSRGADKNSSFLCSLYTFF